MTFLVYRILPVCAVKFHYSFVVFCNDRLDFLLKQTGFPLEIDRRTVDNPRIMREKVLLGLAYLDSPAYEQRFGHRSGRWLVVTTGMRRLTNMLSQARKANARGLFYFTTFDQVNANTLLFQPILRRTDRAEPVPLVFLD